MISVKMGISLGNWNLFLATLHLLILLSLFDGGLSTTEGNYLSIVPESQERVYQRALGRSSVFTCIGKVEVPEKLTDFRWWWPDGKPIEPSDSKVEVMRDEPGSLTLLFSSVQEEDLGLYKCTATYANNQQLSTQFTLSAFVPITFENAPEFQHAIKNQDYKVKCQVKADPVPQVDWKKDHRLINDSDHYVVDKDGVVIRDVTDADEGVYTCRVRVIQLGTVEERHIKVEVHEKPVITSVPVEVEGVESESVTFKCSASGKPPPEYEWVNHRHQDLSRLDRHVVDKYKGTLQIDSILREDAGIYTCTAKNPAGHDVSKSRLDVVTKPVIEEFKNVTSQVTGNAQLSCRASGDPAPDVVFHKDSVREPFSHGSQQDTRIFTEQRKSGQTTTAIIKITDILRTDDGLYKCIAYNKRTRTELDGHLTVEYPPSFAHTPMREAWSWDAQPVNLTCLAEGIPNATISWFIVDSPVEITVDPNTPNMRQVGFQSTSSLEIRPIDLRMYRFYKCVATNKLGTSEHRIHLREARKPGQILQIIVQEKTATSIKYKIVGPIDDGGLPVTSFVAQYKDDRAGWEQFKIQSWPIDQPEFIVENLEPLRTYYFRFAAENVVGIGDWAHERPEVMPRRSAPEPPLILNEAYSGVSNTPYPDRFELRWSVPPNNGERIEAFEITYVPVRNYTIQKGAQVIDEWESVGQVNEAEKPLGEPRHLLRNLVPGTFYRVEIRARNVIGKSNPAQLIIKTAPIPGGTTGSYDLRSGQSLDNLPILIVVILSVLLIILILVDLLCCRINQMGMLWRISNKLCGKKKSRESLVKGKDGTVHEKLPLADESNDFKMSYDQQHIIPNDGMRRKNTEPPKDSEV